MVLQSKVLSMSFYPASIRINRPKIPQICSAQFVCPSPKVWDFQKKALTGCPKPVAKAIEIPNTWCVNSIWHILKSQTANKNCPKIFKKVAAHSIHSDIWVSSIYFQKSNISWPGQPPTERMPKFYLIFNDSTDNYFFKHQNKIIFVTKLLNSRTWLMPMVINNNRKL